MAARILDGIDAPADLLRLDMAEMEQLADEIRFEIIHTVHRTGGHLGSNLGVVEMTLALHRVYDFRRDRLVWDVSHQTYPHKLVTGRRDGFGTIRQTDGLSGFCRRGESPFDLFTAGHAGTAASAAVGLACGDALVNGQDRKTVAVVGDAGLGCGVAFEALNHAGDMDLDLLVILNDNEWSIAKSVGALGRYLSKVRTSRAYRGAKKELHQLIQSIPMVGENIDNALEQTVEILRHSFAPGGLFEELGLSYYGPLDGHDLPGLITALERVREMKGVVLLHLLTEKGHGFEPAATDPQRAHGISPGSIVPGEEEGKPKEGKGGEALKPAAAAVSDSPKPVSYTKAFASALEAAAERDERVCAITAGMPDGTGLSGFGKRFPKRFFDTGITEQHAVAFGAGLAEAGLKPVAAIYSTFLQRGYDQVFQEVLIQDLPLVFGLDRAGLVGADGPTHNGLFDIAFLRTMPGMTLMAPWSEREMVEMLDLALDGSGPAALRYPRGNCPGPVDGVEHEPVVRGKASVLRRGDAACVFALGPLCDQALEAAALLAERGIHAEVANARFAKPIDREFLLSRAEAGVPIVVVEEHTVEGGLGSAVLEALDEVPSARVVRMGVPDSFQEHASSRAVQLERVGLTAEGIAAAVHRCL